MSVKENNDKQVAIKKLKRELPLKTKIGYGTPGLATLFTFTMFTTYGLYFFTDVVGLSAAFAGIIMMIGTLWDAVTDPLVGMISDKRDPKKGRRRPFMFWIAIPFGIATWLLFTDFGFGTTATRIYFIIVAIFFYTSQTLIDVPYTALSGEMTLDYDERSTLGSIRIFWALFGVIIGGPVIFFTSQLQSFEFITSQSMAWSVAFLIYGIICTISIFIGWKSTKGYEFEEATELHDFSIKAITHGPLKNKSFLFVTAGFIFGILAQAVFLGSMVYYMQYNLQLSEGQIGLANTLMWIIGVAWVYPVNWWSQKFSKKVSWNLSFGIWGVSMIVFPWLINTEGNVVSVIIMFGLLVVGLNALYQVIYALIPDCVEVDELISGERREGVYYSLATVSQKVAAAVAISLLGAVIGLVGYIPGEVQTPETLMGLKLIFTIGTAVFCLLSVVMVSMSPLSKQRHKEVVDAIERKEKGEKVNLSEFKDLYVGKI